MGVCAESAVHTPYFEQLYPVKREINANESQLQQDFG